MEFCNNELDQTLQSNIPLDSSTFHLEDFFNAAAGAVNGGEDVDFSSADSFLDFSDEHHNHHLLLQEDQSKEENSNSQEKPENLNFTTAASFPGDEFPLLQQQHVGEFEDLEWFSRIMDDEDSDSKLTLLYKPLTHHRSLPPSPTPSTSPPFLRFSSTIPGKPRTKRTKLVGKLWGSAAALSISSSSSSSSTTVSYGSSNPSITSIAHMKIPPVLLPENQKTNKKRGWSESKSESKKQSPRCSHCYVENTPQWRSGPLGPKTLCNACGVRFKAGKLFPEYRPACSPNFSGELHSNSHKKVLEMRRRKET